MNQEIVERFNNYGITLTKNATNVTLAEKLAQQDSETLRTIIEDFSDGGINLNLQGDEYMQCMTMSYALVSALEDNRDKITLEDISAAQAEIAGELGETLRAARNPSLKQTIYDLVQANPDMQKSEVVERMIDTFSDTNEGTIAVHYYNARKEFELPTIGQRGRPAGSGKLPLMREYIQEHPDAERAEVLEWAMDELGLKETTAANYYAKANK
jgi:c-di-GMP-binding flagellar brake protein YcgR